MRGCAPDSVRVAPVREGAHKAAIDIREVGHCVCSRERAFG